MLSMVVWVLYMFDRCKYHTDVVLKLLLSALQSGAVAMPHARALKPGKSCPISF